MKNINLNDYVEKAVEHYWISNGICHNMVYFNRNTIIDELAIAINPSFENDGDSDLKAMMEAFFEESEIEEAVTGFYEMFSDNISQWLYDCLEQKE